MYHDVIPKDPTENVKWRVAMLKQAAKDPVFRNAVLQACEEDSLFFFNAMCYVFEPRPRPHWLPFITWPHQDEAILTIEEYLGYKDIGLEKARAEGATWMACTICVRHWLFEPAFTAGFVSRNEEAVDKPGDSGALMWKLDKQIEWMPPWLKPRYKRSIGDHSIINLENEATMIGYSATGNVASGGRTTVFVMDELAKFGDMRAGADKEAMDSTFPVTDCRLIMSTPKGMTGAYYDAMHTDSDMVKVILDWKDNPTKNRGLYEVKEGQICVLDPENNPLPPGYEDECKVLFQRLIRRGFTIEGRVRSKWYDDQCIRTGATPQSIAQELDRDYGGSGNPFFTGSVVDDIKRNDVQAPLWRGDVTVDPDTLELRYHESADGPLKLWVPFKDFGDGQLRPDVLSVSHGQDISHGAGGEYTSMSASVGFERKSGEQVYTYTTRHHSPKQFCDICYALGFWFRGIELAAFMVFESTGAAGGEYKRRIMELQYPNCYHRKLKGQKGWTRAAEPGWTAQGMNKANLLFGLREAIADKKCILRDVDLVEELPNFVYDNGAVLHAKVKKTQDEAAKGAEHSDRTIAAGCGWLGVHDVPAREPEEEKAKAPYGSMAHRLNITGNVESGAFAW